MSDIRPRVPNFADSMRESVSPFRYQSQKGSQSAPGPVLTICTAHLRFEAEGEIAMRRAFILFFVIFGLCLSVSAQDASKPQKLVPGPPVEREIAGGESHTYQINLTSG